MQKENRPIIEPQTNPTSRSVSQQVNAREPVAKPKHFAVQEIHPLSKYSDMPIIDPGNDEKECQSISQGNPNSGSDANEKKTEAKSKRASLSNPAVQEIHLPSKSGEKLPEDIMETMFQRRRCRMPVRAPKRNNTHN
ncbi:hypothetical protein Trydic_g23927 [Trypoxylus dichotomus]